MDSKGPDGWLNHLEGLDVVKIILKGLCVVASQPA
jgi:hypothetical protein